MIKQPPQDQLFRGINQRLISEESETDNLPITIARKETAVNEKIGKLSYKPNKLYSYREDNIILIPSFEDHSIMRNAFYGGRVELFKHYGENIYCYDVNSLFPSVMLKDMPARNMYKSTDTVLGNYFGVCYASVIVPDDTYNPILAYRGE